MSLSITFSLFFFTAFAVCIFWGLFVFFRNTNNSLTGLQDGLIGSRVGESIT